MKYSQSIGITAAICLVMLCFLPWCTVDSLHIVLTGRYGRVNENLNFGRQIIPQTFFSILMVICFATPRVWAKRTNIFVSFMNLGWALKNYILFSLCRTGICPSVQPALYAVLGLSVLIQVMSLLPSLKVKK